MDAEVLTAWAHIVLEWIGFGTLTGLLAKAIMPGRDPGGAVATVMMGIGGCVIGCGILAFFWPEHKVTPLSGVGFVVAIAGAFVLLFFYRLLGGYFFIEGDDGGPRYYRRRRRRRTAYLDE
jgi:uncharacterized membrane protein YeaQ/YmgE (transglycosylase-associated protein family)